MRVAEDPNVSFKANYSACVFVASAPLYLPLYLSHALPSANLMRVKSA
jgi:hypothetical protein